MRIPGGVGFVRHPPPMLVNPLTPFRLWLIWTQPAPRWRILAPLPQHPLLQNVHLANKEFLTIRTTSGAAAVTCWCNIEFIYIGRGSLPRSSSLSPTIISPSGCGSFSSSIPTDIPSSFNCFHTGNVSYKKKTNKKLSIIRLDHNIPLNFVWERGITQLISCHLGMVTIWPKLNGSHTTTWYFRAILKKSKLRSSKGGRREKQKKKKKEEIDKVIFGSHKLSEVVSTTCFFFEKYWAFVVTYPVRHGPLLPHVQC